MRQSWGFAGCPTRDQEIYSRFNLPGNEVPQRLLIERAILMKRGDECGAASAQLHVNKIARGEEKWLELDFPPDVLEVKEALFADNPLSSTDCSFGEAAARFRIMAEVDGIRG